MGVLTGYSRRTASLAGAGGGGGSTDTIYTADDVIADNNRIVSLYGNTNSQSLAFVKNSGGNLTKWYGDGKIDNGSPTSYVQPNIYLDPTLNDNFVIYSGSNGFCYYQAQARNYLLYGTTTGVIQLAAQSGKITATGDDGGFRAVNASGVSVGTLETEANGGWFFLGSSGNVKKVEFYVPGNQYYFTDGLSLGYAAPGAPAAILDVKGQGSTSTTTSALFRNSSSVSSLKIRDDNYVIQRAINSAIADGDLSNNEMSFYINESTNHLMIKVKYSTGTVKTGSVNLT